MLWVEMSPPKNVGVLTLYLQMSASLEIGSLQK